VADEDLERRREPQAATRAPIDLDALRCSLCDKAYADVERMVCGPTLAVAICNECVELCGEIMTEERAGRLELHRCVRVKDPG